MKSPSDEIAYFLENIPSSQEISLPVNKINPNLSEDELKVLFPLLLLFNSIEITKKGPIFSNWEIRSMAPLSHYFHNCLARYLSSHAQMIGSWDRLGVDDSLNNPLDWGVTFLRDLEERRVEKYHDKVPTRTVDVVQIIIKAQVEGSKEPMFLVQLDQKINQYQFIGGRKRPQDADLEQTVHRELTEELDRNPFIEHHDYKLLSLSTNNEHFEISPTFGAYTKYNFSFYQILFNENPLNLGGGDIWVTTQELREERALDGKKIRQTFKPEQAIVQDYEGLPLSTERIQPKCLKRMQYNKPKGKKDPGETLLERISKGEGYKREFKSTIRWDRQLRKINKELEKAFIKEIAAFLNSDGGELYIGVSDDGTIHGLKDDLSSIRKKNLDGYTQLAIGLISEYLGVEFCSNIDITYEEVDGLDVCVISVRKAPEPVFVKIKDNREFYVRRSNTTMLLDSEETYKYIMRRFE